MTLLLVRVLVALLLALTLFLEFMQISSVETIRVPLIFTGIVLTGLFTGMTYPVASRLYRDEGGDADGSVSGGIAGAGRIYAMDLLGGCLGGVTGAIILLPAFGMKGSFLALVLLKGSTALLYARGWRT